MQERIAESLADAVRSGNYVPTVLDACEASLALDRNPQTVRFSEFTLFSEPQHGGFHPPRFLVLQPQRLVGGGRAAGLKASFLDHVVRPLVDLWESELPTAKLPDARTARVVEIRKVVRDLRTRGSRLTGDFPDGLRSPVRKEPAEIDVADLPAADAPENDLRSRYGFWISETRNRLLRRRARSISALFGVSLDSEAPELVVDAEVLTALLVDVLFPPPYQPFNRLHPFVAVCATYEQVWQPTGYTRGELLSSLTLAPGERVTLEVHTWDKSSRKTEQELATESDIRTSEKLTQRDALTVVQEYARQRSTKVDANAVVPIPKMPVKVGANVATETRQSLQRTRESVRDRSVEAANTLKVNRKTRIEVSREVGREERQTRVIENTNRCHSLNCHYFEVMSSYVVTTRLASVRPCVLLPGSTPAITVDWVLCHEGILIASLLDRTFLPGFHAAKTLKTQAVVKQLEAQARMEELERLGEEVRPFVTAIANAYAGLTAARDAVVAAAEECGPGDMRCWSGRVREADVYRTMVLLSLPGTVKAALERLALDVTSGRNPAQTLRSFLTVVSPIGVNQAVQPPVLEQRLRDIGLPPRSISYLMTKDPLTLDDAGLRAAVEAAAAVPAASAMASVGPTEEERTSLRELAEAQVEFERLRCHLQENRLHYVQAVSMREDHGHRFMRLQAQGPIATVIDNELLGFFGDRAAYPLRDLSMVPDVDLPALLNETATAISEPGEPPVLITLPTDGVILEATVGRCDGCEEYIQKSRLIDLRVQEAKAVQEESEANRLRTRVAQGDLADPTPDPGKLVVEVQGLGGQPGRGGGP